VAGRGRSSPPIDVRLWTYVDTIQPGHHWLWTGRLHDGDNGYARIRVDGRLRRAHMVAYELLVGPVPPGLVIDHLCRVRHCLNPDHLEPVPHAVNVQRGYDAVRGTWDERTNCINGHRYPEVGYRDGHRRTGAYYRRCLACESSHRQVT
jgi:hypothetical protein